MKTFRQPTRQKLLSRREALKVLAAVGGSAVASTLLLEKWVKPAVKVGVLPAHAQSSIVCEVPYTIDRCQIYDIYHKSSTYLHIVSTVTVKPACKGIPVFYILDVLDTNLENLYSLTSSVIWETNSFGEMTMVFSVGTAFPGREAYMVSVTWKFAKANYGTDSCATTALIPPKGG